MPRRRRLNSVPFRPAEVTPWATQSLRSELCFKSNSGELFEKSSPSPNPHPRKNFYNGPWLMLRLVFFALGAIFLFMLPFGHGVSPSGEVWDAFSACDFAFPAWGKGGLLGAVPLLGPLCTPPGAPPKRVFSFRKTARARVLCCGSFLPSLRSVR